MKLSLAFVSKRLRAGIAAHPLASVALLAAVARIGVGIILAVTNRTISIAPDQAEYMVIAQWAAHGTLTAARWDGYGRQLFGSTATFAAPLTALVWLGGSHLVFGQLIAGLFGCVAAVLTTMLVLEVTKKRLAIVAGALVAVWPSQVIWSSVALRESMVWTSLIGLALLFSRLTRARSDSSAVLLGLAIILTLWGLVHLRDQTFLVVAWALLVGACLVHYPRQWIVRLLALLVVLALPLLSGLGIGGLNLVSKDSGNLGTIRANMALGAKSAIVSATSGAKSAIVSATSATTTTTVPSSEPPQPGAGLAAVTAANNSTMSNVRFLPRGVVAFLVRPFPWQHSTSTSFTLARVETVLWWPLYVLAIAGAWVGLRKRRTATIFPFITIGSLVFVNALIQGNLGTSFRQRAQLFSLLLFFACLAVQEFMTRRASISGTRQQEPIVYGVSKEETQRSEEARVGV